MEDRSERPAGPGFVHLHVHTEYSLLDGACRTDRLFARLKELGQTACAVTDHGAMYGAYDFYKKAKAEGIKPIIGCEVYLASRTRFDRVYELDRNSFHLLLLCKDEEGYKNLCRMVSFSHTEGFYNRPRVDMELLRKYSGGLICLSACIAGKIPQLILGNDCAGAKAHAEEMRKIFGEGNFFLEIQDHGLPEQKKVNAGLFALSEETGIPLAATNDAHYISREDAELHDVLLCIQTNKTLDDPDRMRFETQEFYIKSAAEMADLFPNHAEALANTVKIADMCEVEIGFNGYVLPEFPLPRGEKSPEEYLEKLCAEGLERRYGENPGREYKDRLDYELSVINSMGFANYFLIVNDYIRFAKRSGIAVGPGRGSGAGSLAAYCLGITGLCPVKNKLYFERFLNPERINMPDFDIDFLPERRDEVIAYVAEKYGAERVVQIATYGTMAARMAVRDVARAMGMPYAQGDAVAKQIPRLLNIKLDAALKMSSSLRDMYENDAQIKKLIDFARGIEGMPRNISTHAAGVVVTDRPAIEYVPLALGKNGEGVVSQYTMTMLEELGLVKMDFLGLRNLTVIDDAVGQIRKKQPEFDLDASEFDDERTYSMLAAGKTSGVFQLESPGMTGVAVGLVPHSLEDITAIIALYRPGPMDSIPKFIEGKHHPEKVVYRHELLRPILGVTYGCMVYQEQVMDVLRRLAGYSFGRADIVRRAMSKKHRDVIEKERKNFIHGDPGTEGLVGCVASGVPEGTAEKLFDEIMEFADYAFNKAHAAAYAVVTYQTAYLKCNYPQEYMGALLSSVLSDAGKMAEYIAECREMGINVLPPDVNYSEGGFTCEGSDIRFGLVGVKNVGAKMIADMVAERRENGRFASFADFCRRMSRHDFNRRAAESLIKCGSCDGFGLFRAQMMLMFEPILETESRFRAGQTVGQINLFGDEEVVLEDPAPPNIGEYPLKEKLNMEKETIGLYLSGHPLDEYADALRAAGTVPIREIIGFSAYGEDAPLDEEQEETVQDGQNVKVGGVISAVKFKLTKKGEDMVFASLEDFTGSMEMIVFPAVLTRSGGYIRADNPVIASGRLSIREGEPPKLVCDDVRPPGMVSPDFPMYERKERAPSSFEQREEAPLPQEKAEKLYLKIDAEKECLVPRIKGLLEMFPGERPVVLYMPSTGQRLQSGRDLCVCGDERLTAELCRLLGECNVKVK